MMRLYYKGRKFNEENVFTVNSWKTYFLQICPMFVEINSEKYS